MTLAEALKSLHKARRISAAWLPGMKTNGWMYMGRWAIACGGGSFLGVDTHGVQPGDPSLTDPATVGCLLSLLREASQDPGLYVSLHPDDSATGLWLVRHSISDVVFGGVFTEGEAIAKAIVRIAEAL